MRLSGAYIDIQESGISAASSWDLVIAVDIDVEMSTQGRAGP